MNLEPEENNNSVNKRKQKMLQANDGSFLNKNEQSAKPDYYQLLNELLSTATITTNNKKLYYEYCEEF